MGFRHAGPALALGRCHERRRGGSMRCWPRWLIDPGEDAFVRRLKNWGWLTNTVYALDSTTTAAPGRRSSVPRRISSCTTRGGGESAGALWPLASLRGQHSEFYPHLAMASCAASCPRYALAGSRSADLRKSWILATVDETELYVLHEAEVPSSSTRSNRTSMLNASILSADGSLDRLSICDAKASICAWTSASPTPRSMDGYPKASCGASAFKR